MLWFIIHYDMQSQCILLWEQVILFVFHLLSIIWLIRQQIVSENLPQGSACKNLVFTKKNITVRKSTVFLLYFLFCIPDDMMQNFSMITWVVKNGSITYKLTYSVFHRCHWEMVEKQITKTFSMRPTLIEQNKNTFLTNYWLILYHAFYMWR